MTVGTTGSDLERRDALAGRLFEAAIGLPIEHDFFRVHRLDP